MSKLYIYRLDNNAHVATVTGAGNEACESAAADAYDSNDYGWTYSPAFGAADGLVEGENAKEIAA